MEKAAEVLEAAQAMIEESGKTVESVIKHMAELTIECNRKVREEQQHWSTEAAEVRKGLASIPYMKDRSWP